MATFIKGQALNTAGEQVSAWGVTVADQFIVNAFASACGRFHADPMYYGLTREEAYELKRLNDGRDLMAYWDL